MQITKKKTTDNMTTFNYQVLAYHYDGFHHLKLVDTEKATNNAIDYYNTVEELVENLTVGLCNHLDYINVLPTFLKKGGHTAETEDDWDNKYVEAVIKWITENIALFSANLKLAVSPKPGYIARKYVYTTDDWHPTCGGGFVMIRFVQMLPDGFRIAVWGGDDFGLEKDLPTFDSAEALYKELTEEENLTVQSLLDKGFACV